MVSHLHFAQIVTHATALAGRPLTTYEMGPFLEVLRDMSGSATVSSLNLLLRAMQNGKKIEAIKEYRAMTGMPLKESKDAVEAAWTYRENEHPVAEAS